MTRDEAIKLGAAANMVGAGAPTSYTNQVIAHNFIAVAVALGMLKLDEPKGPNERAVDAMFAVGSVLAPRHVIQTIENAGLKIVEK